MTNFEWMLENDKDLVKSLILGNRLAKESGKLTTCACMSCTRCDWYEECDDYDYNYLRKWLDEEYKEPSFYDDWEIDDKIEVSDDGEYWYKRYFAEVSKNGYPATWNNGATSWSSNNGKECWRYARKVEE